MVAASGAAISVPRARCLVSED